MRVLVVEDDYMVRGTLSRILPYYIEGAQVDATPDTACGLELYKQYRYDAVLLDNKVPKMGGVWLMKEIRKINPVQKIVFLTALMKEEVPEDVQVFIKPSNLALLAKAIS